jgi:hypothetical protein
MEEINRYFGRWLAIENGGVAPGHPAVRDVFLDPKAASSYDMPLMGSPERIHGFIADICLRYLALPSVQALNLSSCNLQRPLVHSSSKGLHHILSAFGRSTTG